MKTIQELIDFFEAIPSERWLKGSLSSWAGDDFRTQPEQNCAFGHLNKYLHGRWNYGAEEEITSWDLVSSLNLSPIEIVGANNSGLGDAKTNVINFLKEKLKEAA